jgi:hypothetical protein
MITQHHLTTAASVAVESLTQRRHGGLQPVPALAFGPLGMSRVRHVTVSDDRRETEERDDDGGDADEFRWRLDDLDAREAVDFLLHAPVNVSRLAVGASFTNVGTLFEVLGRPACRCHALMKRVALPHMGRTDQVNVLLAAAAGWKCLHRLAVCGPAAMQLVEGNRLPSLRHLVISVSGSATIDLSAERRLRSVTLRSCRMLQTFVAPSQLLRLGRMAFTGCDRLVTVDLSNTALTVIEAHAFGSCETLKSVAVPSTLRSVESCVLTHCPQLTALDLSHTAVDALASSTVSYCTLLASMKLPATVTRLCSQSLFHSCSLRALDLSQTALTVIETLALADCTSLATLALPSTLEEVGDGCLTNCFSLAALDLSHTVLRRVGDYFMRDCTAAISVTFPSTVCVIGEGLCFRCTALTELDLRHTAPVSIGSDIAGCCENIVVKLPQ